jgi:hypothetical protein
MAYHSAITVVLEEYDTVRDIGHALPGRACRKLALPSSLLPDMPVTSLAAALPGMLCAHVGALYCILYKYILWFLR